jgi:polyhydroxyalkanoate synthesis regulator phasin
MSEESKFGDFFQKLFSAGWGFVTFSEEKARSFIDEMIRRGEISQKEGEGLMKNIMEKIQTGSRDTEQKVREMIRKYSKSAPPQTVPMEEVTAARAQIDELRVRIAELEKRLAEVERKGQEEGSEEQL